MKQASGRYEKQASCLYEGMVRHRRYEPVEHGFHYPIQLLYLDLSELPVLFRDSHLWSIEGRTPVSFRRADHFGDASRPLDLCVRELVEHRTGHDPDGPVRLLTSPRYLGFAFNPISVYYCFASDGERLEALVGEVTNTPWGERHCYVIDLRDEDAPSVASAPARSKRVRGRETPKAFHVSPFMEMEMDYSWRVARPERSLTLSIRNERRGRAPSSRRETGAPYFQADLALTRAELSPAVLRRAFFRAPFLSGRVVLGIYWQALRLFARRVPFVTHPPTQWPRRLDDPALLGPPSLDKPAPAGLQEDRCA